MTCRITSEVVRSSITMAIRSRNTLAADKARTSGPVCRKELDDMKSSGQEKRISMGGSRRMASSPRSDSLLT
jgi:hypothetical protein